jgi:CRP/FNR family transcriptional regulator
VTVHLGDSRGCSSFQLSEELLGGLAPLASEISGAPNQIIVEQGTPGQGVYIVRSGLVRLSILQANSGKEIFQRLLGPGCVVGLPAVLCSQPYNFTARCQSECKLEFIESSVFQEFLRTKPVLCMEVVRLMGQELSEMNERRTNFDKCRECGCKFVDSCEHEMGNS